MLKKYIVIVFASVFLVTDVNAVTCNYEEKALLNNEVVNLKTNYEIKERILDKSEYDVPDGLLGTEYEDTYEAKVEYIQVNFLNLTENMYVEVTNDYNDEVKVYRYSDTSNGNFSFDWKRTSNLVTFTFKVYASNTMECEGALLKTINQKLPRFNTYSMYSSCSNFPDYYLCQRYVTYDEIDYGSFMSKMNSKMEQLQKKEAEKKKEENKKWYEKTKDFVVKNKVPFIIGGVVLIVAGGSATYIIIKKRRSSIL